MCNVSATILKVILRPNTRTGLPARRHDHEAPGTIRLHEGQAVGGHVTIVLASRTLMCQGTQEVKTETHPETKVTLITSR